MISILRSLERVRGHTISTLGLGPNSTVVDAGAHKGEFSQALSARFGCRCVQIEANPELVSALKMESGVQVVSAALAGADGSAQFIFRQNIEAGSLFPLCPDRDLRVTTVEKISLETLLDRSNLESVDLLKLDIEGAEFEVLGTAPAGLLRRISQITVEFHDFLPEFAGQGLFADIRSRLNEIGFACCSISFRTSGDVIFLSRERFNLRPLSEISLALAARFLMKCTRPEVSVH